MNYLSKAHICEINRLTVKYHGGNFTLPNNFLHEENLDYLIEIVESKAFGVELYPTLSDKSALYMFSIISNHVFQDGNKRTGLEAAILFLRLNGKNLDSRLTEEDLISFTIAAASGGLSLEELQEWFREHVVDEYL